MIKGVLINNSPWIQIILASKNSVQKPFVILDTGFTGDLWVTPKIAKELGLKPIGVETIKVAGGKEEKVQSAIAIAHMEGINKYVQVLISEGFPLAGISFFAKFSYKITVDCGNKIVALEKAIQNFQFSAQQ